jgi:hypothetical protein
VVIEQQDVDNSKVRVPPQCFVPFDSSGDIILVINGVDKHVLAYNHAILLWIACVLE